MTEWQKTLAAAGATELMERHQGHAALGPLIGTMEYSIAVNRVEYRMYMQWSDELRKIERALGRS